MYIGVTKEQFVDILSLSERVYYNLAPNIIIIQRNVY